MHTNLQIQSRPTSTRDFATRKPHAATQGVDSRLIFKLEPFRGGFLRSTQIVHSPYSKMVGICLQYHKIQRYWKIYKVCGINEKKNKKLPSFCSRSAKSCAAAKAAVPGNGLPPAASKLAVSVASVQHPSSIHYTWICCEMSSETTDSVISSNMMSYLSIMHNFKISRD